MGLQPATTWQVHGPRRDIVDRCAAVVLERRGLLAWLREANFRFRNGRFRRRIGSLFLDLPIRRQSQTVRKHLHRRRETLVGGRLAIICRGESIVERRGTILQSVETLLERRVTTRRCGRVGRHGSRLGRGIEQSDLRFQACHLYAIACRP